MNMGILKYTGNIEKEKKFLMRGAIGILITPFLIGIPGFHVIAIPLLIFSFFLGFYSYTKLYDLRMMRLISRITLFFSVFGGSILFFLYSPIETGYTEFYDGFSRWFFSSIVVSFLIVSLTGLYTSFRMKDLLFRWTMAMGVLGFIFYFTGWVCFEYLELYDPTLYSVVQILTSIGVFFYLMLPLLASILFLKTRKKFGESRLTQSPDAEAPQTLPVNNPPSHDITKYIILLFFVGAYIVIMGEIFILSYYISEYTSGI